MLLSPVLLASGPVVVAILSLWAWWRWKNRRLLSLASKLPGPPALPLIGNAWAFMVKPEEQLKVMTRVLEKYGDYVRFWLGPELNIIVKDPGDIRLLLCSNKVNKKGPAYTCMEPFIGNGILSGGPLWRLHRKVATPAYNKRAVRIYGSVFNAEAQGLVERLRAMATGDTFDLFPHVLVATTQSVCQTLVGLSKEDACNLPALSEIAGFTEDLYDLIFSRMTKWWYKIPFVNYVLTKNKEKYFVTKINEMTTEIVKKRKIEIEKRGLKVVNEETLASAVDRYIITNAAQGDDLRKASMAIFTTSQEAAAKIAAAVILFLAHLPDWQENVYKEIVEVLGKEPTEVSYTDCKKLKYLDCVYKEAVRYLPIAAMIQRTVHEEVTIRNGRITLPVGTSLVIPLHDLHRDPRFWQNPNKVDPGRFGPDKKEPNAYVPFSLGTMDCLGRVFATALIKTLAIHVIRNYRLEAQGSLEDLPMSVAISVRFACPYNIRLTPRHR